MNATGGSSRAQAIWPPTAELIRVAIQIALFIGAKQIRPVWMNSLELSPFLRQPVKTQNSANRSKTPLNGGLSHGFVSTAVHQGVHAGRRAATGNGSLDRKTCGAV